MLYFALEKCLEMLNYVLCYCCLVKLDKYIVLSCLNVITNNLYSFKTVLCNIGKVLLRVTFYNNCYFKTELFLNFKIFI